MPGDQGSTSGAAVYHPGRCKCCTQERTGKSWIYNTGSRCYLSGDGRFCFCQNDACAIAKAGMSNSDGLAIERYQLLSDAFWLLFGFQNSLQRPTLSPFPVVYVKGS